MNPLIIPVFKNIQKNLTINVLSPTEIKMLDLLSWHPSFQSILYCSEEKIFYHATFSESLHYELTSLKTLSNIDKHFFFLTPLTLLPKLDYNNTIVFYDLIYSLEALYSNQELYNFFATLMKTPSNKLYYYFQSERIFSYIAGVNIYSENFLSSCIIDKPVWLPKIDDKTLEKIKYKKLIKSSFSPFTVIWGGALYDWYDPFLAINTIFRLYNEGYSVKLIFPILNRFDHSKANFNSRLLHLIETIDPNHDFIEIYSESWLTSNKFHDLISNSHLGITTINSYEVEDFFAVRNRYRSFLGTLTPYLTNGNDIAKNDLSTICDFYTNKEEMYALIKSYLDDKSLWINKIHSMHQFIQKYEAHPNFSPTIEAPEIKFDQKNYLIDMKTFFINLVHIPEKLSNYEFIVIWGASYATSIILPIIEKKVIKIIDNNPQKWNTSFGSYVIYPVDVLSLPENAIILVNILFQKNEILATIPIRFHLKLVFLEDIL